MEPIFWITLAVVLACATVPIRRRVERKIDWVGDTPFYECHACEAAFQVAEGETKSNCPVCTSDAVTRYTAPSLREIAARDREIA